MVRLGNNRLHFTSLTSTNDYLKEYSDLPNGTAVTTDYQTKGRGSKNNVWESSKNQNVILSVLVKDNIEIREVTKLTQVAAASVYKTLESLGINSKVKQPNDVFVNGKKICGILLETSIKEKLEYLIIGIGLNVNQIDFDHLNDIATSIKKEQSEYDVNHIIDCLLKKLNIYYEQFLNNNDEYLKICRSNNYTG
ncbi:biotin--[acetyl-CoA-carboxylase] ligase [Mycoplasmatota bacterium WC44]